MIDNLMKAGSLNSINGLLDSYIVKLPYFYLIIVFILVLIAIISYKTKQLTISGAILAAVFGTIVTLAFGTGGLLVYIFFIVAAGVLSKINENNKIYQEAEEIQEKGNQRDAAQVFANAGIVFVLAFIYILQPSIIILIIFGASVSEAVCDTASGEVGMLFNGKTVSIITGIPQKSGLSGGVSYEGTLGGFVAVLITAMIWYTCFFTTGITTITYFFIVTVAGFSGCMVDSLLGASIQAHYYDNQTDKLTEKSHNEEGHALPLVKGNAFFDNDKVNFFSNLFSVIFALLISSLIL
ncbi:MAG: DUF92 domain-containing protein [Spirochaetaceae bacterium]|nr:DUF92 domain-containing protein [Spirochaetaceae bacterium]